MHIPFYLAALLAVCLAREQVAQQCHNTPVDVVVMLDGSSSVGEANFRKSVAFAKSIMDSFTIAPDQANVAVLQFASEPQLEFSLGQHSSKQGVLNALDRLELMRGATFEKEALEFVESRVFSNDRPFAPNLVFLVSDGQSHTEPGPVAARMKAAGVRFITIGVALNLLAPEAAAAARRQLLDVADSRDFFFEASNFDQLRSSLEMSMLDKACKSIAAPPQPQFQSDFASKAMDCEFFITPWSDCTATCGGGTRSRATVIEVAPKNGGRPCPAGNIETESCNNFPCPSGGGFQPPASRPFVPPQQPQKQFGSPVDCEIWYDPWTLCSKSCGGGQQQREGQIEVEAQNGGRPCGPLLEKRACNVKPCQQFDVPKVNFDCTRQIDGFYPDPDSKCSKKYVVCANGQATLQECPGKLYFDTVLSQCDAWILVKACSNKERPITTRAPPTTRFYPKPTPVPEFDCKRKPDGQYNDPKSQCSPFYYVCHNGYSDRVDCPPGLFYDQTATECNGFMKITACGGRQAEPPKYAASTPGPTYPPVPVDCASLGSGDHPDPKKKCSEIYYSCTGDVGVQRDCAPGTYFDPQYKICDSYQNVPACSGKPRPVTPRPKAPKPTVDYTNEFDCTERLDGFFGNGQCDPWYWSCVGGLTFKNQCIKDTYYDAEFNRCEFKHFLPECGGQRPTSPLPTQREPAPTFPPHKFDCTRLADGQYTDPATPCSRSYYTCSSGETFETTCPAKLYYDLKRSKCALKKLVVACKSSLSTQSIKPRPVPRPQPVRPAPVTSFGQPAEKFELVLG